MKPRSARRLRTLEEAHGKARLLSVGVAHYRQSTRLAPLPVCGSDASTVVDRFLGVQQLNVDRNFCVACTGKAEPPTRGTILGLLADLASASNDDRIIFYYSGHGVRINDEFYIVPQDAYDIEAPDALIAFERIQGILNASQARQKIVILDACFSGRDVSGLKALPAHVSTKFMTEYLRHTKGAAVLSSSGIDQESTAQSPNPKLSLFTHYLCEGLAGAPDALDNGRLTVHSLYEYLSIKVTQTAKSYAKLSQHPVLSVAAQGSMILGDFTERLVTRDINIDGRQIETVSFDEREPASVKDFLTNIRNWSYSQEYLERQVNKKLPEEYEEIFGKLAARLTSVLKMPYGEISTGSDGIVFPDGSYTIAYHAHVKTYGIVW